MFDLEQYLSGKQTEYIKAIYLCTGTAEMEGLLQNVRANKFPCIMVEVGDEGFLDIVSNNTDTRTLPFYILESKENASPREIKDMLSRTKQAGMSLFREMRKDAQSHGDPCYGIDFSRIDYFKVGQLGLGAYGYCFNLTIVEE